MPARHTHRPTTRILLIRSWTHKLEPVREALRAAGIEARFARVDIEPALNAALVRSTYAVAIFDPTTPGLTRELVETRIRECARTIPIVILGDLATLGPAVACALETRLN